MKPLRQGRLSLQFKDDAMVTIELDPVHEQHLVDLAPSQGEDAALLARRILSEYLDFLALPEEEDDEAWAKASVRMAAEAFEPEDWGEGEQQ